MDKDDAPTIVVGFPFYPGNVEPDAILAATVFAQSDKFNITFAKVGGSNTAKAFNILWAGALNAYQRGNAQKFALLHSDCIPEAGWLETLHDLQEERGLAVISAVSPIKNQHGLTSCGFDCEQCDPWKVRRLTMTEVMDLPETFQTADLVASGISQGTPLLINTGCMLIDLSRPEWQEEDEAGDLLFLFTFFDRIRRNSRTGKREAHSISEDWNFSRLMAARGIPYAATRKVKMIHEGRWSYKNWTAWGDWKTDEAHEDRDGNNIAMSEEGTPLAEMEEVG